MSYSYTTSESFTIAHARKLAARVSADMKQCNRFYFKPSDAEIEAYNEELVVMLAGGYVSKYEFGFKTADDRRVVSWLYKVTAAGDLDGGRSGGMHAWANVSTAKMFNFMSYSDDWFALDTAGRQKVKAKHSIRRTTGEPPLDGNGLWVRDRTYSAGGVAIERQEFRPWSA